MVATFDAGAGVAAVVAAAADVAAAVSVLAVVAGRRGVVWLPCTLAVTAGRHGVDWRSFAFGPGGARLRRVAAGAQFGVLSDESGEPAGESAAQFGEVAGEGALLFFDDVYCVVSSCFLHYLF